MTGCMDWQGQLVNGRIKQLWNLTHSSNLKGYLICPSRGGGIDQVQKLPTIDQWGVM